ncbi:transglutaminase domain-containing protein [Methanomethylophilus alvi]|uniref:transglutaminase domain-containing protein n=1 Tax=Methanomethylophilus alvi TaxID=1291540 RepID=UPI0037DDD05E
MALNDFKIGANDTLRVIVRKLLNALDPDIDDSLISSFIRSSNGGGLSKDALRVLDDLCSNIKNGTDLDKEKQVHDIIIKNVNYRNAGNMEDHTAEGLLKNHYGVCDGISNLANEIFRRIGIKSYLATGDLLKSDGTTEPHGWNIVCISGIWFHLDITSDLGLTRDKNNPRYDYFNLSDSEIGADHKNISANEKCLLSNRSYYSGPEYYCPTLDVFEQRWKKIIASGRNSIVVKLPETYASEDKIVDAIIGRALKVASSRGGFYTIQYNVNQPTDVIEVFVG